MLHSALLIVLTGCAGSASSTVPEAPPEREPDTNTAAYWKGRIAQLRPGMSRKEVEEILPWYDTGGGRGESGTGSGVVLVYAVSPDWSVQIGLLFDEGLAEGSVLLFSNDGEQKFEIPVRRP